MQEVKNAGFEEGTPKDWQTYSTGAAQRYTYPEPGRLGGSSVAIEYLTREAGKIAIWVQDVQIGRTKKYKLSGWIKTQNIIGSGASIKVDWKDTNGKFLNTSAIMSLQKGTVPWKYFEGTVIPNASAVKATIALELFDCSGKVWFDDIFFSDITMRYRCSNGQCIQDPNGPYSSLAACQTDLKYACINNQCATVCPDFQGAKYNTLAECINVCGQIPPDYRLVFEDHFKGNTLDATKWTNTYGSYSVENSNLVLGVNNNGGEIRGCNYDFANRRCISAKYKFKYGYVEFRAKLADTGNNRGYANQLWFVNVPGTSYGEIDVIETATGPIDNGNNPYGINKINLNVHCPNPSTARGGRTNTGLNLSSAYHVYAAEWTPTYVRFLLDGNEKLRVNSSQLCIPNMDMFLIMGLCKRPVTTDPIQCWPAVEPGNVPAKMYVDYVRVYQK